MALIPFIIQSRRLAKGKRGQCHFMGFADAKATIEGKLTYEKSL